MSILNGDQLYSWLLEQETEGDDDRRFYSSYLLGHVSLSIADTEEDPSHFEATLNHSVDEALAIDKLTEQDIQGIRDLLAQGINLSITHTSMA